MYFSTIQQNIYEFEEFFALVSVVKQLDVPAISMAVEDAVKSANEDLYFIDTDKVGVQPFK